MQFARFLKPEIDLSTQDHIVDIQQKIKFALDAGGFLGASPQIAFVEHTSELRGFGFVDLFTRQNAVHG